MRGTGARARVRGDKRESLSGVREGGTFFVGPMHFGGGGVGGVGSESAMAAIWSSVRGEEHENGWSESTYVLRGTDKGGANRMAHGNANRATR